MMNLNSVRVCLPLVLFGASVGSAAACFECVVAYDFEDQGSEQTADITGIEPLMPAFLQPGSEIVQDEERGSVLLTPSGADAYGAFAEHTSKLDFTESFTLQAWLKVFDNGVPRAWQQIAGQPGSGPRMFNHWGAGALGAVHLTEGDTWAPANFGPGAGEADSEWHHILMTWDQATGLFSGYYDGVLNEVFDEFNRRIHPVQRKGAEKVIHENLGFGIGGGELQDGEMVNPMDDALIDDVAYWSEAATGEIVQGLFDGSLTIFDAFDPNPISGHPCDFNGNDTVDFGDFVMFSNVFGQTAEEAGSQFDKNENGTVDFGDFVTFSNSFGQTVGDIAAVPEPTSLTLFGLSLLLLSRRRRRVFN